GTALRDKGFHVFRKFSAAGANPGDILLVGLGGSDLCYVTGHDQGQVEQVVHCLQAQPFTGVIFSRNPVAGTFSLADAHLDSPDAPDLVVAMRWTDGKNQYGVPGMMYGDNGPNFTSKGSHG